MSDFIFGIRPVLEAIRAGKEIDKVLVRQNMTGDLSVELMTELRRNKLNIQYVPAEKLDKITNRNHQGVVAYISPVSYANLENVVMSAFDEGKSPIVVILDGITDVRNFGAIARTCECAGVTAIVIPETNSARITEDAIKTSAGALYNIPVCREKNLVDSVLFLQQSGFKVYAATEKTENVVYDEDFSHPTALIMGAEDLGVSKTMQKRADKLVKIPMYGKTESLNVSVSTAVLVYEVVRQQSASKKNDVK
jgi:23S rRNA (guanosine2251-2'-O)-methyltransferase